MESERLPWVVTHPGNLRTGTQLWQSIENGGGGVFLLRSPLFGDSLATPSKHAGFQPLVCTANRLVGGIRNAL